MSKNSKVLRVKLLYFSEIQFGKHMFSIYSKLSKFVLVKIIFIASLLIYILEIYKHCLKFIKYNTLAGLRKLKFSSLLPNNE